ncbi:MAG: pyridoxal 5'-phosphate synthase glutaminase subunit PdxT [Anaerolineae bacterium]
MARIGILALQGDFAEHGRVLDRLGSDPVEVRLPRELDGLDGLIIPGGESTAIGLLAAGFNLVEPIRQLAGEGFPIWGTCAGMILLAKDIGGGSQPLMALMDLTVERNAYGRQLDSFEAEVEAPALDAVSDEEEQGIGFPGVFIRAPAIRQLGDGVEVLARLADGQGEGAPVGARQGTLLATTFHPELTDDSRFHRYFLHMTGG